MHGGKEALLSMSLYLFSLFGWVNAEWGSGNIDTQTGFLF